MQVRSVTRPDFPGADTFDRRTERCHLPAPITWPPKTAVESEADGAGIAAVETGEGRAVRYVVGR